MPEAPNPKLRPTPPPPDSVAPGPTPPYAELDVATNFSFLRGASHPDELMYRAAELGYRAIAVTDYNSLAGVVRAHEAAQKVGVHLLIGARLILTDAPDLLVWAPHRAAYAKLCRLLTLGKRRSEKGECTLHLADILDHADSGLLAALVPPPLIDDTTIQSLRLLRESFTNDRLSLSASCLYAGDDASRLRALADLSRAIDVPLLATNGVHYHDPARRILQDVLTCIRHGCSIPEAGFRLFPNGERYLKPPMAMHRLFADHPQTIDRALQIAERCTFSLEELRYEYPHELVPAGQTPIEYLAELTWAGAATRYPHGVPQDVRDRILHELKLIEQLHYEAYFLTVYDLVRFARGRGILCQGRGSAANSAVCYCLGVTSVDPARIDVLFERFVSAARNEPPDIDVDFEHERREEVIQYVYEKYGRERAGMTAEVITYRGRSAVRDVGKALGLGLDLVDQMARRLDWWHRGTVSSADLRELGLNPDDRTIRLVIELSHELLGFPRHLSQHVGGMVMTRGPLCELVPIENASMPDRTVIEWDKDDIDAVGILKVDVLALGMLTCISKAFALLNGEKLTTEDTESTENTNTKTNGSSSSLSVSSVSSVVHSSPKLELHTIPPEDPAVYDMICNADTIGVFQIESRAQMSMLPRLCPRCFYDLVIEVAIVRPGPIQGNMVHPYLRRRIGQEPIVYPSEALRQVLYKTLGVPLFQEQAMRLVMVGAGFSAEEADQLRRAMAAWRRSGEIAKFHQKILDGMRANGYTPEFAEQCFNQIKGFGEYGFPESHAASFALLVYVSAWLKCHHPAAFAAALLNSQPMGFYAPAQIVRDAREHGVEVLPVDVNASEWDCTLEEEARREEQARRHEGTEARSEIQNAKDAASSPSCLRAFVPSCLHFPSLRLGLRQIRGLARALADRIPAARQKYGPFTSIAHFRRATALPRHAIERLAQADAFASLGLSRRQALWMALALKDDDAPLFDHLDTESAEVPLPYMPEGQQVMADYATTSLSLKRHPLSLVRDQLAKDRITPAAELKDLKPGRWVKVAGLVLIRQRPGTASGIVFVTLEDETGVANLIVRPEIYDRHRPAARHAMLLQADGYLERQGQVIHVMAKRLFDRSDLLAGHRFKSRDFH
jgi:error-prone DNA polymerase